MSLRVVARGQSLVWVVKIPRKRTRNDDLFFYGLFRISYLSHMDNPLPYQRSARGSCGVIYSFIDHQTLTEMAARHLNISSVVSFVASA
jgi:hypothetical protein